MTKGTILVADDELILTGTIQNILAGQGYRVHSCTAGEGFLSAVCETRPDLVLLDIYLGSMNGIDLLRRMRAQGYTIPVVMMTAHSDVSLAVNAMKEGAIDFVVKPFDLSQLTMLVGRLLEQQRPGSPVPSRDESDPSRSSSGIIGRSASLRRVLETAEKLAQGSDTTVLLEGESGTGKELLARFIHLHSARAGRPFVTVNCGAIPKDLAESELFGYERGAFTGAAEKRRQGKFELADEGTILLDEVCELSLDMQVKLLRVLEEKKFYRLGGTTEVSIDVRIIAASNRNLLREVEAGRFREDLYYRLNVAAITIPPLRSRSDDIPDLADTFLWEFATRLKRPVPHIAPEAIRYLQQLPWKGNVRELRNAMERVILLNDIPTLLVEHFAFLRGVPGEFVAGVSLAGSGFVLEIAPEGTTMNDVLKDLILKTLDITGGNQVQAARVLGVTRAKLRYGMEQLGIHAGGRLFRVTDVVLPEPATSA